MLKVLLSCAALILMATALPVWAQDAAAPNPEQATTTTAPATDLVPPQTDPVLVGGQLPSQEYPLLRLTPDKTEVVHLDRDAATVIIGNSKHVVAVLETPRQILLVPRLPGATHFQAVDAKGETVMARSIIVASPKQDYIRVRRSCSNKQSGTCEDYSVYYCPDMCHQIAVPNKNDVKGGGIDVPEKTASAPASDDAVETTQDEPEATAPEDLETITDTVNDMADKAKEALSTVPAVSPVVTPESNAP